MKKARLLLSKCCMCLSSKSKSLYARGRTFVIFSCSLPACRSGYSNMLTSSHPRCLLPGPSDFQSCTGGLRYSHQLSSLLMPCASEANLNIKPGILRHDYNMAPKIAQRHAQNRARTSPEEFRAIPKAFPLIWNARSFLRFHISPATCLAHCRVMEDQVHIDAL